MAELDHMTTDRPVVEHWIGGRRHASTNGRMPVHEPRSGGVVADVTIGRTEDVDAAVASAVTAARRWRDVSLARRQALMFDLRGLLLRHSDELAQIVSIEHGKTIDDGRGEVARGIEVVEYACGIAQLMKGDFSEEVAGGVDTYSIRQPVGVCVGITPFNFPVMVPLWMAPMAIACGNSFILKPSERDPSASLRLAELFSEAGLPDGVFNVVHGDAETVTALMTHADVAAVSFVGSTPVARHVYATAAAAGKRVQALGGAKNHMVVLPDADVDTAADAAVSAAYGSAGERCMAISVVVAVGGIADELVAAIAEKARAIRVGDGMDVGTDMGPLITAEHRDRVAGYVDRAAAAGLDIVVGPGDVATPAEGGGYFHPPVLIDDVGTEDEVYRDEVFGPLLSVVRLPDLESAIELINANPYGNGVALFTESGPAARLFQREVSVGMVGINIPIPAPMSFYSFGGWKNSLFGDRHVYGPESVDFYTRSKVVTSRWRNNRRGVDLGFMRQS